jgi:hypothetical protein
MQLFVRASILVPSLDRAWKMPNSLKFSCTSLAQNLYNQLQTVQIVDWCCTLPVRDSAESGTGKVVIAIRRSSDR